MISSSVAETYDIRESREREVPPGYVRLLVSVVTGADIDVPISSAWRKASPFPAWEFRSNEKIIRAKRPVQVSMRQGEELFFAENETLQIFAVGENASEAKEDFSDQLVYFHEYYGSLSDDQVIGEAARLKEIYQNYFEEVSP